MSRQFDSVASLTGSLELGAPRTAKRLAQAFGSADCATRCNRSPLHSLARQYRDEPPPGFPLASPCSGIDHHLSGPTWSAPTQWTVSCHRSGETAPACFHCALEVCNPRTRRQGRLLGPCFKTGRGGADRFPAPGEGSHSADCASAPKRAYRSAGF
jgi:hypothetical protein